MTKKNEVKMGREEYEKVMRISKAIEGMVHELCNQGKKAEDTAVALTSVMMAGSHMATSARQTKEEYVQLCGETFDMVEKMRVKNSNLLAFLQSLFDGSLEGASATSSGFPLPPFEEVQKELEELHRKNHDEVEVDVLLEITKSGQWTVLCGAAKTNLPGAYYGKGKVPGRFEKFDSRQMTIDLVEQAHEACHGKGVH